MARPLGPRLSTLRGCLETVLGTVTAIWGAKRVEQAVGRATPEQTGRVGASTGSVWVTRPVGGQQEPVSKAAVEGSFQIEPGAKAQESSWASLSTLPSSTRPSKVRQGHPGLEHASGSLIQKVMNLLIVLFGQMKQVQPSRRNPVLFEALTDAVQALIRRAIPRT